jgi:UDP-N-acetylmuramoyl-tripeptide--D-alanyl-D-alanine ligase
MLELGELSRAGHDQVGEAVFSAGVNYLLTVGDLACWIAAGAKEKGLQVENIKECTTTEEAVVILKNLCVPGDVILIKGSRSMHLEKICEALLNS